MYDTEINTFSFGLHVGIYTFNFDIIIVNEDLKWFPKVTYNRKLRVGN